MASPFKIVSIFCRKTIDGRINNILDMSLLEKISDETGLNGIVNAVGVVKQREEAKQTVLFIYALRPA